MLLVNSFCKSQPARIGVMIGFALLLIAAAVMNGPRRSQAASRQRQSLTFEERVAAQRAIEEVYWRHRIWPKENPQPKPSLDEVMPEEALRAKVEDYLRMSSALEVYWQRPITGDQLQAEIGRMARQTKQPEVLRELWAALGNDPLVVAECLARPQLVRRLVRNWYVSDERFHRELKQRAEVELSRGTVEQMRQMSGEYRMVEWVKVGSKAGERDREGEKVGSQQMDSEEWNEQVRKLIKMFGRRNGEERVHSRVFGQQSKDGAGLDRLPVGRLSVLQEDEARFYVMAVVESGVDRLLVASVEWRKTSVDEWWSTAQGDLGSEVSVPNFEYRLPVARPLRLRGSGSLINRSRARL